MVIAVFVVHHAAPLNTLLRHADINVDFPVGAALRRHNAKLHRVERMSCISS